MPLKDKASPAPREVRIAGMLTCVPGLAGVGFAAVLLVYSLLGHATTGGGNSNLGEAGYFAVLGGGALACGIGLLLGKTWARSPAVVVAVLLGGVGWYIAGPSGRPLYGVPCLLLGAAVIVLLFRAPSRAWVLGEDADDDRQHR